MSDSLWRIAVDAERAEMSRGDGDFDTDIDDVKIPVTPGIGFTEHYVGEVAARAERDYYCKLVTGAKSRRRSAHG
ncbi:hypothetical protein PY730_27860 (plasmid) [Klebsiella pneumoniae]|nr:hypothetical protein PY730_27860 [Klebsiella pneumoniae]